MNQILLTENQNEKKKNKTQYGNNNSPDMKRIIIFFGIAILIFALLLIGVFAYKLSKNSNNKKETEVKVEGPQLSLEESGNNVKIISKSDVGIAKVIYSWNDEEIEEINKNGEMQYEETLEIPEGTNKLKVKIIDLNNDEIETEKEFYREEDKEKPKIKIDESIGSGRIKIIATDENNQIKLLKYRWNDEEETEIAATEEGQTVIETIIDVKRGENVLNIVAINKNDKEQTFKRKFNGVNKPKIEVVRDDSQLIMKMTHDMGFKKIVFKINGQEYNYDENYSGYNPEQSEVTFTFGLKEGENNVEIHAISNEKIEEPDGTKDVEETYIGRCDYSI